MMNKKAIAAFAAGATLLSGMAFAAPAFAAETPKCTPVAADKLAGLKQAVTEAQRKADKAERTLADEKDKYAEDTEAYNTAKGLVDAFKQAVKNYKDAKQAVDDAKADAENKGTLTDAAKKAAKKVNEAAAKAKENDKFKSVAFTDLDTSAALPAAPGDTTFDAKLGDAPTKREIHEAEINLKDAQGDLQDAKDALAKAQCTPAKPQDSQNPPVNPPAQTADPSKSAASAELMRTQVVFAEADAANKDAQAKYVKAKADFEAAKTQMAALDAQVKSAADREEALRVAGKTDTDAYKAAVIDLKAAQSKANAYKTHEYADAQKNFVEKSGKALLAATAYNAALVNYRAAYNKAVEVEASAVKGFADPNTLNPVSTDFPAAPAGAKAEAKKVEAKAEAKTQAAAGKAAAKGELATKGGNGHGKSGEKLGNAGVGVALTALAASMLAGMGAAVRKMRH
ncbi:hypothetical protein [Gardnerella vaginalis]|uniref:hypothetical protein n=1 Tax=Gardnerella vaginalis TaxID=2702 RepID=UPI0039705B99